MAFPKKNKRVCVYIDASEKLWSTVVTEISSHELSRPVEKEDHEQLAFLGAAFTSAERNWSSSEQEGFSFYQAFKKLDFLFHSDAPTHVFTDHRNLLFVFSLLAVERALGRCVN